MFNHLKLKIKLIALLIPLLLGLLIYSMVLLSDRWLQQHDAALVVERMHLLKEASNLVHELQKERGMTSGFLATLRIEQLKLLLRLRNRLLFRMK